MYCIKKLNGSDSPIDVVGLFPLVCAITTVIIAARTGFGGWVPPAGVNPANVNSVNPPATNPSYGLPTMIPVKVPTIMGLKIKNPSSQKSIPTMKAIIVKARPCVSVIEFIFPPIIQDYF